MARGCSMPAPRATRELSAHRRGNHRRGARPALGPRTFLPYNPKKHMATSGFQRRKPPMVFRCVMGLMIDGIFRPMSTVMNLFGRGEQSLRAMGRRQRKELLKHNPFGSYVPTCHDVFVAVYVKSGTNWAMQIVHQLLNHGQGEYQHVHDVIPWPDLNNFAFAKGYAVPLEDETAWRASPEQKRAIKTHLGWGQIPYSEQARYIHVIRDPKDVFVSSYFFFGSLLPIPSVDAWFKYLLAGFRVGQLGPERRRLLGAAPPAQRARGVLQGHEARPARDHPQDRRIPGRPRGGGCAGFGREKVVVRLHEDHWREIRRLESDPVEDRGRHDA